MIAFNLLSTNIFSKFVFPLVQALNWILYMPNEAFLKARYNEEKIMEKKGLNTPLKKLLYKTIQSTFEHIFSKNQIK